MDAKKFIYSFDLKLKGTRPFGRPEPRLEDDSKMSI
jgi:hypothetical protein